MVTITLADVSVGCKDDLAQARAVARLSFRNPRGLTRFYTFYIKDVGAGDVGVYGWSTDGFTWPGGQVDLAGITTTGISELSVTYVEDVGQLIVYLAGKVSATGEVRIRRGTIADAASIINWNAEEELYAAGVAAYNATLGIDNNGYLWSGTRFATSWNVRVSTNAKPGAPIAWSGDTQLGAGAGFWHISCTPYGNGMVFIGWRSGNIWACYTQQGAPPTDEGESTDGSSWMYSGGSHCITDLDGLIHLSYGVRTGGDSKRKYYHRTWDPITKTWGSRSTIYDAADDTDGRAVLILDTSRTPNYLYAIYEHGTGMVEYKTTPYNAITWSAATTIEDHAENVRYIQAWYFDDPVTGGNIFGTFQVLTADTVRSFLIDFVLPAGEAITRVKVKGWWGGKRGKKFFLDGDTFVGQDLGRWTFDADDTGFSWLAAGQATIPADRAMNSKHTYAYAMLTAVVQSADMSDAIIGFYTDGNHYAWIEDDQLATRNGTTAEKTTDISASLPNGTRLKIVLIWTSLYVRLIITNIATGARKVYEHGNAPQIEATVTFQVIAAGSNLLVEDYALFDAENDIMYALGILPYDVSNDAVLVQATIPAQVTPTTVGHGANADIDNAAEQITAADVPCRAVIITAHPNNTDRLWIGGAGIAVDEGTYLNAGDSVTLWVDNVNEVYAIAEAANQKASWTHVV